MSVQFGRWNLDGMPLAPDYLNKVRSILSRYGPDGESSYSAVGLHIAYHSFHTTKESRQEVQPRILNSGSVMTWDGRLDNRTELQDMLSGSSSLESSDLAIVAAAYERCGLASLPRLVGDWALSIWNPGDRSVILARDPIGARHLYYSFDRGQLTWCTILDPLVLFGGRRFALDEEYIAGWLSSLPATHLTPYAGIHSVPPSTFVRLRPGTQTITKYWDFDPSNRIRYRTDTEYEEHFRVVFSESVRRRLRSDAPVLAELSGGIDSSSIVCVADSLIGKGLSEAHRLDTVSYYDDSDPHWNERPYFTKVEEKRGRTGCHIDVGYRQVGEFELAPERFISTPFFGIGSRRAAQQLANCLTASGNRVILSGLGGDEVTGGVPSPMPELRDLLGRARFYQLAHQLKVWAVNKRTPWFHLLLAAAKGFSPPALVGAGQDERPAPWLDRAFVKRNRTALRGCQFRLKLFGPLPSFQENVSALETLRRQLGCSELPHNPPREKRYPYLDRDLLVYLYAIPREQLVRPGQRRSLVRRALLGTVPSEVLNRRRKAFAVRTPLALVAAACAGLPCEDPFRFSSSLGVIAAKPFWAAFRNAQNGQVVPLVPLLRAVALEAWLIDLAHWRLLCEGGN